MKITKKFFYFSPLFISVFIFFLNFFDIATTYIGITYFNLIESNNFLIFIINYTNIYFFVFFKLFFFSFLSYYFFVFILFSYKKTKKIVIKKFYAVLYVVIMNSIFCLNIFPILNNIILIVRNFL